MRAVPITEHRAAGETLRAAVGHLPSFHLTGLFLQVFVPIASLRSVSVYAPTAYCDPTAPPVIPTSQNALENALVTHSNGILAIPAFLEEWALSPDIVKRLSQFIYVVRTLCFRRPID